MFKKKSYLLKMEVTTCSKRWLLLVQNGGLLVQNGGLLVQTGGYCLLKMEAYLFKIEVYLFKIKVYLFKKEVTTCSKWRSACSKCRLLLVKNGGHYLLKTEVIPRSWQRQATSSPKTSISTINLSIFPKKYLIILWNNNEICFNSLIQILFYSKKCRYSKSNVKTEIKWTHISYFKCNV